MKFKKHFLVFSFAWAVITAVISDILLISSFRGLELNTDRGRSYFEIFLVPAAFTAADLLLIGGFSIFAVKVLRRRYHALEGHREYAFFRNYVLILAVAAAANTLLLLNRYFSVMDKLIPDERRRLSLMYSAEPAVRDKRLSELSSLISRYDTLAVIAALLFIVIKAAGYLFTARKLVKAYYKNVRSAYSQEVR